MEFGCTKARSTTDFYSFHLKFKSPAGVGFMNFIKTHEIYGPLTPYHKPKLVKFGQIVLKKKMKRIKCFSKTHIMHDDGGKTRYTDFDLFKDYQQMFSTLLKKQVCVWILFS